VSLLFVERIEHKYQLVLAGFGMAVFGIGFGYAGSPALIVVLGVCYTMTTYMLSNAFHIYQAEVFPTHLRATAASWVYALSRVSSGAMTFILVPVLDGQGANVLFAVIAACIVVAALTVGVFGPRSNGLVVGVPTDRREGAPEALIRG
jgi:putative MFS transporter